MNCFFVCKKHAFYKMISHTIAKMLNFCKLELHLYTKCVINFLTFSLFVQKFSIFKPAVYALWKVLCPLPLPIFNLGQLILFQKQCVAPNAWKECVCCWRSPPPLPHQCWACDLWGSVHPCQNFWSSFFSQMSLLISEVGIVCFVSRQFRSWQSSSKNILELHRVSHCARE